MLAPAGCTVRNPLGDALRRDSLGEQQELTSQLGGDSPTADAQGLPQPKLDTGYWILDTRRESRIENRESSSTDARVPVYDIPRFSTNSPFDTEYDSPVPKEGKRLWAASRLWAKAPDFVVEKWLSSQPDISGKYVLITFWATWCRQCRLAVPGLNDIHRKFADELVVIGISDEKEQTVRKFRELKIEYHVAIDTQARMKNDLGVFGIPHCIIVEPDGYVVWEGFPLLKGHELTEEVVEKILEVGKKRQPVTDSGS
ncbi:MAG: TlpA family protein disulfide reductase [Planctomycetes bacterium]|nr:TlpA family protein disulfide reductase [Planctomycetota bacterium]